MCIRDRFYGSLQAWRSLEEARHWDIIDTLVWHRPPALRPCHWPASRAVRTVTRYVMWRRRLVAVRIMNEIDDHCPEIDAAGSRLCKAIDFRCSVYRLGPIAKLNWTNKKRKKKRKEKKWKEKKKKRRKKEDIASVCLAFSTSFSLFFWPFSCCFKCRFVAWQRGLP